MPWLNSVLQLNPYLFGFLLLLVEEAGLPLPIPGDVVILYMAAFHRELGITAPLTIGMAIIASVAGSNVLYWVFRKGGDPLVARWGHYVHVTPARLIKARFWAEKYGFWAILGGRLLPGMRIASSIAAGTLRVPYPAFFLANLIAALIWWPIWYAIGAFFGPHAITWLDTLHVPWTWLVGGVALVIGVVILLRRRKRLLASTQHVPPDES